jgi:hypothetical protein
VIGLTTLFHRQLMWFNNLLSSAGDWFNNYDSPACDWFSNSDLPACDWFNNIVSSTAVVI